MCVPLYYRYLLFYYQHEAMCNVEQMLAIATNTILALTTSL